MSTLKTALAATAGLMLLASATTAYAVPATNFIFNPSTPGLALPGSSQISASQITIKDYAVVNLTGPGTTAGNTAFTENGYLQFTQFTPPDLTGNTFTPPGLNSSYSLYMSFTATGQQSAANFATSSLGTFSTLSYTLYGDNGVATFSTTSGTPVVTNNGTLTTIATGSLDSGTTGFLVSNNGTSFAPVASLTANVVKNIPGFFVSPANLNIELQGQFGADAGTVTGVTSTSFTLNGGAGTITLFPVATPVPEPASMALLGAGLAAIGLVRRRRA